MVSRSTVAFGSILLLYPNLITSASAQDLSPPPKAYSWVNRAAINLSPWRFHTQNTVGWAQAARAATHICRGAGHFTGHEDFSRGTFGLQCSGPNVVTRDASAQEIAASGWSFNDVNQVSWAQANRAAERLCAAANQGFSGGHFNGHQLDGKYGLVCYTENSQWFDASDAELAATGFGFATPKLDDVQWAQAMRAAAGYCQSKGFDAGFMNGHQAPNKYGVVCQKIAAEYRAPLPEKRPLTREEQWSADLPGIPPRFDPNSEYYDPDAGKPTGNANNAAQTCQVGGSWDLIQSNKAQVTLALEQRGEVFSGTGQNGRTAGVVEDGRVVGRDVSFRISWADGPIGRYQGKISREGRLDGSGYAVTNVADVITWWTSREFKC